MNDIVAEAILLCITQKGDRFEVPARLGRPYQTEEGDWACPVSLSPLHPRLADIHGADSLQALCLAASLIRKLLTHFREDGGTILNPDQTEFDLHAVFSGIGAREA